MIIKSKLQDLHMTQWLKTSSLNECKPNCISKFQSRIFPEYFHFSKHETDLNLRLFTNIFENIDFLFWHILKGKSV